MKKIFFSILIITCLTACSKVDDVIAKVASISELSTAEMAEGLKAALEKGTINGVMDLSQVGGYENHELYKIYLPESTKKVETTLRSMGFDDKIDMLISLLNKGAEDAVTEAKPIFINAIQEMTISDAKDILFGADTAATAYLESKTRSSLYIKFEPYIAQSLNKVNATKYWNEIMTIYNNIPLVEKINPDLNDHVTNRAIDGLFLKIAKEEKSIREDPLERTSEILKKVFNYASES